MDLADKPASRTGGVTWWRGKSPRPKPSGDRERSREGSREKKANGHIGWRYHIPEADTDVSTPVIVAWAWIRWAGARELNLGLARNERCQRLEPEEAEGEVAPRSWEER